MTTQIRTWLDNAILQSVAESYIDQINAKPGFTLDYILSQGVNHPDLNANGTGATRLTTTQISWFKANYEIVTHYPNDATGFSATLFKNKTTGEYTLSFRSTEYQLAGKGGDYERDGVNGTDGEISQKGFALAQLSSMEDFYAHLKNGEVKNPITGQWVGNADAQNFADQMAVGTTTLDVTGYSLGAHLATAFTLMHGADTQQTYTYNAAGVGAVGLAIPTGQDITGLIELYRNMMAWDGQGTPVWWDQLPSESGLTERINFWQAALAEPNGLPAGTANVYQDAKHQATMAVLAHLMFPAGAGPSDTDLSDGMGDLQINNALENWWASSGAGPLGKDPNAFSSSLYTVSVWGSEIKQFYGHGEFFDPQAVANSGYHAPASAIWIEDLPVSRAWGILEMLPRVGDTQLIRDLVGDFGETHSITPIIDSLTVLDLLQGLDGSIDNARFTQIMKAMSNRVDSLDSVSLQNATAAVLTGIVGFLTSPALAALGAYISADKLYDADAMENFVNALTRIFTGTQGTLTPKKMQDGSADPLGYADVTARNDLHVAIEAIRASTTYQQSAGLVRIQALASVGATDMAARAKTDMGYRYALKELLPFAITGDDALYAQHNAMGGLDYYDAATGTGSLTDAYLNDRAAMLVWKIKFDYGKRDINDLLIGVGDKQYDDDWESNIADNWEFIDRKTQIDGQPLKLTIDGQGAMAYRQIIFGSDLDESDINGGNRSDRLYGGGGADTLTGNAGNDYLEGGAGFDTYVIDTGDGIDTLLDTDGSGTLILDGITLSGGALVAGTTNVWKNTAQGITYTLKGSGASQILLISKDGSADGIRVQGWQSGHLGLTMAGVIAPPATSTLTGADGYSDALTGGGGSDRIFGLSGNDALDGSAGDDLIGGNSGSDLIYGGAGRDMILSATGLSLYGTHMQNGEWTPPAGAGAVWTQGRVWGIYASVDANGDTFIIDGGGSLAQDSAGDIVFAGDDDDRVVGGLGADYIDGGLANDDLSGHGGNDVIDGGDGDDVIEGDGTILSGYYSSVAGALHGNDVLDGGAGIDTLIGGGKDDGLFGGTGNDTLYGDHATEADLGGTYHGSDYLDGGDDDDELLGGGKDDTLLGGAGTDKLWGDADDEADLAGQYHGNDYLDGGAGNDQLVGGGGNDILVGGLGNDVMFGDARNGVTLTAQYEGNDILYGEAGDDQLIGGGGNDNLYGGDGADDLFGNDGIDHLDGAAGGDYLDGGTGADIMAGGADDDTYIVDDAGDVVIEAAGEGIDTVESSVTIVLPDNVEWLNLTGAGDIDATGNAEANNITGNAGANRLEGGAGNDQLIGGAGTDTLIGGTGDDYYEIDDTGDTITEALGEGVDFVRSTVSYALADNLEALALDGSADLAGTGNDLINSLYGNLGNNTLAGGAGNDYLAGDAGDDVYVFNRGDGQDSIDNTDLLSATDTLRFGAGIADSDVVGYQVGTSMVLKLKGSSEQVAFIDYYGADTINGGLISDHKIDRVEFANGVVWDQAMIQTVVDRAANNHAPVLNAAVPALQAYADDAFSYVVPADAIADPDVGDSIVYSVSMPDGSPMPAWLAFDATTRTLSGTPAASDIGSLQFVLWGTDDYGLATGRYVALGVSMPNHAPVLSAPLPDQAAVQGSAFSYTVAASTFADPDAGDVLGFSASLADGSALPSWLSFDAATRTFSGIPSAPGTISVRVTASDAGNLSVSDAFEIAVNASNHAPVLSAALSDQAVIQGNAFNYTVAPAAFTDPDAGDVLGYSASLANGSSLPSWLSFDAATRTFSGTPSAPGTISVRVTASDAGNQSVSDTFDIEVNAPGIVLNGTTNADSLYGSNGADVINGLGGDDYIYGAAGGDTMLSGEGNDKLYGEAGNDTLDGGDGDDDVQGGLGSDVLFGGAGNDRLLGYQAYSADDAGNDVLYGGAEDDRLFGGDGNDLYLFGRGDGFDTVGDSPNDDGSSSTDVLRLSAGVLPEHVTLHRMNERDLMLVIDGSNQQLLLSNYYFVDPNGVSDWSIERIEFDGGAGAVWTATEIASRVEVGTQNSMTGTGSNDTFVVDHELDVITEATDSGVDTVLASRSYTLPVNIEKITLTGFLNINATGNALNNELRGNSGDNVFEGGGGSDVAYGGQGNDTYSNVTPIETENEGTDTLSGLSGSTYTWTYGIGVVLSLPDHVENWDLKGGSSTRSNTYYSVAGNDLDNVLISDGFGFRATIQPNGKIGGDILDGRGGADTVIIRGDDKPIVYIDNPGDRVIGGAYEIRSTVDVVLPEPALYGGGGYIPESVTNRLVLLGSSPISGTGNPINNVLDGSQNTAANTLTGGAGDDVYLVGLNDHVVEIAGEGYDQVKFISSSADAGSDVRVADLGMRNIERYVLGGRYGGVTLWGDELDNDLRVEFDRFYENLSGRLMGGAGNDTLNGNTGNDRLDGGTGNDALRGGTGNDTYIIDSATDVITENGSEGLDSAQSSVTYTLGANVENLTLTGTTAINGTGNELANVLTGNSANNTLIGGVGDDILLGGTSGTSASTSIASLVIYARGTPVLDVYPAMQVYVDGVLIQEFIVDAASYTAYTVDPTNLGMAASKVDVVFTNDSWRPDLSQDRNLFVQKIEVNGQTMNATDNGVFYDPGNGAAAFDSLNLRLGQETIYSNGALHFGLGDNDTLDGGAGADQMSGGSGNDTYLVDNVGDVLTEMSNEGLDTVRSSISHTLGTNFENLVLSGSAVINGSGNNLNNLLIGNVGNNNLHGDAGVDTLLGYAGNDWLDGGAGNDFMYGGQGNDTYVVDSAGDILAENINEGMDAVESSISHTLGTNVENLTLTGTAAINGTGNNLDNSLTGNSANNLLTGGAGNDSLDGGAGADVMAGGAGDDYYVVDNAGDIVTENAGEGTSDSVELYLNANYTVGADIEHVYRYGAGNWTTTGNAADNYLYGNSGSDTLIGLAGNDVLYGDAGADTLIGGAGDDRYYVDSAGDIVTENANEGVDTVYVFGSGSLTYILAANVENGYSPFWAGSLTGNALNNTLSGSYGSDTLDGGLGADTLKGWGGNDTYIVDNVGDVVSETTTVVTEIDTIQSSVTYTLGANLENLTLTGTESLEGTGNALANVLRGNGSSSILYGLDGNDTLYAGDGDEAYGGGGNDTLAAENTLAWAYLSGEDGDDILTGGAGSGSFIGGLGNDTITGGAGYNYLWGDESYGGTTGGNDLILGGLGVDFAWGGYGNDTLSGNDGDDTLLGQQGDDLVYGGTGNDILNGGTGIDTLVGGIGNDTYRLGRGYDADTVVENDATTGNTDIAQFLTGVAADQIWFQQVGNNLETSIIGTSDKLVIQDWYLGSANHVEQFKTTDGAKTLLDSNVQNLVNAMASFAPPAAGQTTLPTNYQTSLAPVIAANWQ